MTDGGAFFDYAADDGGGEGLVVAGEVGEVEGEGRDGEVRRERGEVRVRVRVRVLAVVVFD